MNDKYPALQQVLYLAPFNASRKLSTQTVFVHQAVAKHLRILAETRIVSSRKVGQEKIYRLHPEPLTELKDWLAFYEKFRENKMENPGGKRIEGADIGNGKRDW